MVWVDDARRSGQLPLTAARRLGLAASQSTGQNRHSFTSRGTQDEHARQVLPSRRAGGTNTGAGSLAAFAISERSRAERRCNAIVRSVRFPSPEVNVRTTTMQIQQQNDWLS
jgi:hypothetical protein